VPAQNAEIVRAGFDALSRGDLAGLPEVIDPGIEWTVRPDLPEAGTYHGHQDVL
jgi:ketosteroid isomerase-like protein